MCHWILGLNPLRKQIHPQVLYILSLSSLPGAGFYNTNESTMNNTSTDSIEAPSVTPDDMNAAKVLDSLHCQNTRRVSLHDEESHKDAAGEVVGAPVEEDPTIASKKQSPSS